MIKRAYPFLLIFLLCSMLALSGCNENEQAKITADLPATETATLPSSSAALDTAESPSSQTAQTAAPPVLEGAGNTSANLLYGGVAAEFDGYVYHIDSMMEGNIWRTSIGGNESKLLYNGSFHDLNVNGGLIFALGNAYLSDEADLSTYGIFMMNTDGSDLKVVKEGYFEELILFDEFLYYADIVEGGLYRIKYDGSEELLLLENIYDSFSIINGYLYIRADLTGDNVTNIYKMPLDGSSPPESVANDTFGGAMDAALGVIFYIARDNTSNTYRYDTGTGQTGIFVSKWVDYINTDGEYLYYFWSGNRQDNADSGVYRLKPDGSDEYMLLNTETFFDLNIAGGKMFWSNNDDQRRLTVMNLDGTNMTFVEQAPSQ